MQAVLFALGAAALLGACGLGLAALFARDEAAAWRRVAAATGATRLRGRVAPGPDGPLRSPLGDRPCCWYATWVTEMSRRPSGARAGGHVAVFERSSAPLLVDTAHGRMTLDPDRVWVEDDEDEPPFGAAPEHRALAVWPAHRSYAAWQATRGGAGGDRPDAWRTGEVVLEPGADIEVYGVVDEAGRVAPGAGVDGVPVLRAGSSLPGLARERVRAADARRRRRVRGALALAGAFFVLLVAGGATASDARTGAVTAVPPAG